MKKSGIDTAVFQSHSCRAASTSAAGASGLQIGTIMKAAGWSSAKTFKQYYKRVIPESSYNRAIWQPTGVKASADEDWKLDLKDSQTNMELQLPYPVNKQGARERAIGRLDGLNNVPGSSTEEFLSGMSTTGNQELYKAIQLPHANEKSHMAKLKKTIQKSLTVNYDHACVDHVSMDISPQKGVTTDRQTDRQTDRAQTTRDKNETTPILKAFCVLEPKTVDTLSDSGGQKCDRQTEGKPLVSPNAFWKQEKPLPCLQNYSSMLERRRDRLCRTLRWPLSGRMLFANRRNYNNACRIIQQTLEERQMMQDIEMAPVKGLIELQAETKSSEVVSVIKF
ncbi:hypothetical protein DPMN_093943 [Dreissena polymorpha]|uniref:Tyr recombinase domain-containing protein n=1 Tax=Dreissena polymorpha TaxID=45954 RepID=A0A9D4R1D2_DREPO|nr:hypothetical protein DPMN_093943 [Dreissena polymorpha]